VLLISVAQINAFSMSLWEPNNPLVVEIANQLKTEDKIETARNIWDWMNQNILYREHTNNRVYETIEKGEGNCADQAYLAASLFLAVEWESKNVKVSEGSNHMWVEIKTDRWHRFDTTYYHSFEYEYGQEIYQEGVDYVRIDYHYYEPPKEGAKIEIIDVSTKLLKDIHEIKIKIANTGDTGRTVKILIETDIEIIGYQESLYVDPNQTRETKIYLKGEGYISILIEGYTYETNLTYPQSEQKIPEDTGNSLNQNVESQDELSDQLDTEKNSEVETAEHPNIEIKKINFPLETRIVKARSSEKSFPNFKILLPLLLIPLAVVFLRR